MSEETKDKADEGKGAMPGYLSHWPGLSMRRGNTIVEALPSDIAIAKGYPAAKNKGPISAGRRLTILTQQNRYRIGEEVRVIHVLEIVEPNQQLFVMGPKAILGEFLDGRLVTPAKAPGDIYDGEVLESPGVDYNYDITSYKFSEPGCHRLYWQPDEVRSNTLKLEIVPS